MLRSTWVGHGERNKNYTGGANTQWHILNINASLEKDSRDLSSTMGNTNAMLVLGLATDIHP